jgi:hypothetical protein
VGDGEQMRLIKVHCIHILKYHNETHYFVMKQKCQPWWFALVIPATQETGGLFFETAHTKLTSEQIYKKLKKAKGLVIWLNCRTPTTMSILKKERVSEREHCGKKKLYYIFK